MNWLSYFVQAYEMECALYKIRAKMQSCDDATRMVLGMAVKTLENERDYLIKRGDEKRNDTSKNGSSINQTRPTDIPLWQRYLDSPGN